LILFDFFATLWRPLVLRNLTPWLLQPSPQNDKDDGSRQLNDFDLLHYYCLAFEVFPQNLQDNGKVASAHYMRNAVYNAAYFDASKALTPRLHG